MEKYNFMRIWFIPHVRLVHNSQVPTRFLIEFLVCSAVKAGIYGTAATKNASSGVGDPILGCEGLGRGVKCINLSECGQESFLLGLANWDFHKASKKHKNASY